jgi:hypothetical protein
MSIGLPQLLAGFDVEEGGGKEEGGEEQHGYVLHSFLTESSMRVKV